MRAGLPALTCIARSKVRESSAATESGRKIDAEFTSTLQSPSRAASDRTIATAASPSARSQCTVSADGNSAASASASRAELP